MTLADYAPVSGEVRPPRPGCPVCKVPMWLDGWYRRKVRQDGTVHELAVHRVRCPRCRAGHAVLPDFVIARRLDSAVAIGAALAACAGIPGAALPSGVPAHTAMAAIGAAWHTTLDRWPGSPLRGPWRFANAMCGGALMGIRMNVPPRPRPLRHSGSRPP